MSALDALARAKAAGVTLVLEGEDIFAEAVKLQPDVVALLRAVKPDLMRILTVRCLGEAALRAEPPPDASEKRWAEAMRGLACFVDIWGDRAAAMGWSAEELYRVPKLWSQIWLTGAALLIGDRKVKLVTADSIVIETPTGSQLKCRRLGREHLA